MNAVSLGKLLGTIAEIEASEELQWSDDTPADDLRKVRRAYDRMADWCRSQQVALTELIEQHEQQAAAPLGK
jgi:hypothetical protein